MSSVSTTDMASATVMPVPVTSAKTVKFCSSRKLLSSTRLMKNWVLLKHIVLPSGIMEVQNNSFSSIELDLILFNWLTSDLTCMSKIHGTL